MFEHVVVVESVNAGAQAGGEVRAILEPSVEEYAFVTPRDAGSPFFAVSIKYRVNIYSPDGRLADSWGFTGYGTSPSSGLSSSAPLATATALALRDAGAKLAVEFREQAIVRGLMPDAAQPVGAPAPSAAEPSPAAPSTTPSDAPGNVPADVPSGAPSSAPSNSPATDAPATVPSNEPSAPSEPSAPGDNAPAPAEETTPEEKPVVTPNAQALALSDRGE
jgi:hypothetical protein